MVSKVITISGQTRGFQGQQYGFKVNDMVQGQPPGSKSTTGSSRPILLVRIGTRDRPGGSLARYRQIYLIPSFFVEPVFNPHDDKRRPS